MSANETNEDLGKGRSATFAGTCGAFDVFVWHACLYKFNMSCEILARAGCRRIYFSGIRQLYALPIERRDSHAIAIVLAMHKKIVLALALSCLNYNK